MKKYRKQVCFGNRIIVIILIVSIIIIPALYYNTKLYWLLIIEVAFLSIAIYKLLQKRIFKGNYFFNNQQADTQKTDFKRLCKSADGYQKKGIDFSVTIGNDQCRQPYKAVVFNVEVTINKPYKKTVFQLLEYKINGSKNLKIQIPCTYFFGDGLVWQISPDYSGCNTEGRGFNSERFKQISSLPQIKMIELPLPSSNKFKYLYAVHSDTTETNSVEKNDSIFNAAGHSNFIEAEGTIHFLDNLRRLSHGKPIGIRLCIDNKKDFYKICYAIRKLHFFPDYIVVEDPTTQSPIDNLDPANSAKMPLYEALQFVSATLQYYALENKIKLIAAGRINTSFDIVKTLALGADLVYTKMQDNFITNSFLNNVLFNNRRISNMGNYHLKGVSKIMRTNGFSSICDITLPNFMRRLESFEQFTHTSLHQPSSKGIYKEKINTPNDKRKKKLQLRGD